MGNLYFPFLTAIYSPTTRFTKESTKVLTEMLKQTLILRMPRLIFLDNLRSLSIIMVTLFHSTQHYLFLDSFWTNVIPLDVFLMLTLFFIAGYFVLPSLQKKGMKRFLKEKLTRFGIPLSLSIIFVLPILDYVGYRFTVLSTGETPCSVFTYWMSCLSKISELKVGFIDVTESFFMSSQFYENYLWFLSLLMMFFGGFCGVYLIATKWIKKLTPTRSEYKFGTAFQRLLVCFGFLLSGYYFLIMHLVPTEATFFTVGNILQFQPARLGLYSGGFLLGVYAFLRNWFKPTKAQIPIQSVASSTLILLCGTIFFGRFYYGFSAPSVGVQLAYAFCYNFLNISVLLLLLVLMQNYGNAQSIIQQKLADNSYNIYLLHYIPIILLALLLKSWMGIPPLLDCIIVFMSTLALSYGLSEYCIRPFFSNLHGHHREKNSWLIDETHTLQKYSNPHDAPLKN